MVQKREFLFSFFFLTLRAESFLILISLKRVTAAGKETEQWHIYPSSKQCRKSVKLGSQVTGQMMQREPVPQCGKPAKKPDAAAGRALLLPHFGIWVLQ